MATPQQLLEAWLAYHPGQTPPGTTLAPKKQNALARIRDLLDQYGLGSLADWAWGQVQLGVNETQLIQALRETPEYKQRFSGLEQRRAAGFNAISEAEYINYEDQARSVLRAAGFPAGFHDSQADLAGLIGKNVSINEINDRIQQGYLRVFDAPPEVRNAFRDYFGADGDGALAAWFLDPDKAEPALLRQARIAEVGGYGAQRGYGISAADAETVANLNLTAAQVRAGYENLDTLEPLLSETVGEQGTDLGFAEGFQTVFGLGGEGKRELERRRAERAAAFAGGGGGAVPRRGAIGLGVAGQEE